MLVVEDNPEMLISRLAEVPVVTEVKWIGASER
jgi:hypothetical protein